ncbi:MAG: hypothetical protein LJE62_11495 [Silicimonas sp.]|jgi:hypothetical protein|nr:hypothetical protein [Silicimonas sp.]
MTSRGLIIGLALALAVSGCSRISESRFNPLNWFGSSEPAPAAVVADTDPRPRVARVTSLVVEPTPTGAIVRAVGVAPTQGWYAASLVPETDEPVNGEMVYVFRAVPPPTPEPVSTVRSRELSAARTLSVQDLAALRVVRVVGAQNALVARR